VQSGSQGFHAKSHLLTLREGRRVGWIGSSNWSLSGLRDNVEWNVRVDDGDAFEEALAAFDGLWRRDDVRAVDEAFIAAYARDRKARNLAASGEGAGIALRVADAAGPTGGYLPTPQPTSLQREALQRLGEMRATGVERAIVVAATGTGKTLLAAFDVIAASTSDTSLSTSPSIKACSSSAPCSGPSPRRAHEPDLLSPQVASLRTPADRSMFRHRQPPSTTGNPVFLAKK
jgi:hypothetical protein